MSTAERPVSADQPSVGPDEISEILRTFENSGWIGMHLRVGGADRHCGEGCATAGDPAGSRAGRRGTRSGGTGPYSGHPGGVRCRPLTAGHDGANA